MNWHMRRWLSAVLVLSTSLAGGSSTDAADEHKNKDTLIAKNLHQFDSITFEPHVGFPRFDGPWMLAFTASKCILGGGV